MLGIDKLKSKIAALEHQVSEISESVTIDGQNIGYMLYPSFMTLKGYTVKKIRALEKFLNIEYAVTPQTEGYKKKTKNGKKNSKG